MPERRDRAGARDATTGTARGIAGSYSDIFGPDNFYLELQDHGIAEQHRLNEQAAAAGPRRSGLPLVATNDLHYVHREQHEAHDVLLCIGTASIVERPNRMRFETRGLLPQVARPRWRPCSADQPEAISNTRRIAEMIDLQFDFEHAAPARLPGARRPHRRELAARGVPARPATSATAPSPTAIQARLDYELGVIIQMGYAGYFLIVADFVRFAREQRIATTCRGCAPGSIVTYTLGITPVDPIHYELPFERFLNPDRVTMPDIDVDFEDSRRDEVIAYVTRKYGSDHVAQIITFGTMLARAAIRDVGRVAGHGLRRGRPHRQGRAQPAGHQAGGGAPERAALREM